MEKVYNPKDFEDRIYKTWCETGAFHADAHSDKPPFTIVIPPPNITGQLHMGHALNNTLQDAIIRYKRMSGYNALWIPGTDHASIATEVKIVEKLKEQGVSKYDLGRDGFLERAWEWKAQYGGRIVEQLKKLGCSCDWDRLAFTMDDARGEAVQKVFLQLYEEGLIYQGDRIINWCPKCKTALSDAEVDHVMTNSHLWHIRYDVEGSDESVIVATTRPETLFGDSAVAVNPKDGRYMHMIGKMLRLPLTDRLIPVIADEYVESEFGTGCVKITPAHDPNDFEVGTRHNLPVIRVMNDDGTMNELAGKYDGMDRYACRKAMLKELEENGQLVKIEKHASNIGHCYRCKETVEPIVSKQWFVKMDELVKPAIEAVKSGEVRIMPKRVEKIYLNWLYNIKDWCISRQLWWGHRIPAYYCADCGETVVSGTAPSVCPKCGGTHLRQDEDVLDTWFSSALWPFSTLGWPHDTEDLATFFPTSTLVTAQDIIFFWVARMIVMSYHFLGKAPFKDVVINGIVRDKDGKKMSKSSGNGIDPLELIDEYGTDALRFSLLFGTSCGSDFRFSADKIKDDRAFVNKLWNASRFVRMYLDGAEIRKVTKKDYNEFDKWIAHKFNETMKKVNRLMDKYEMGLVTQMLYEFVWNDFCDWYIEFTKASLNSDDQAEKNRCISVLVDMLSKILRALHPIVPFVTEEIFMTFFGESIMFQPYPKADKAQKFADSAERVEEVIAAIKAVRELRTQMNVPQNKRTHLYVQPLAHAEFVSASLAVVNRLASGNGIELTDGALDGNYASVVTGIAKISIPMDDLVNKEEERARLKKEIANAEQELARAHAKLSNPGFVAKAPAALVEQEKAKIEKFNDLLTKYNASLAAL